MNSIVEVETAEVVSDASAITVLVTVGTFAPVLTDVVSTSTVAVPSIAGTSISAVSPDHTLEGRLALGIAA